MSFNQDFQCKGKVFRGITFTATLGLYDDGTLGEIFLRTGKSGTDVQIAMDEAAKAISFALQWGVPFESMRRAMPRDDDGIAEGPLGTLLDLLCAETLNDPNSTNRK